MKIILHTKKLRFILLLFAFLIGQVAWAFDIVSYAPITNLTFTSVDISANAVKAFSTTSTGTISYDGSILQNSGWNVVRKNWKIASLSTFAYHTIKRKDWSVIANNPKD